MATTLNNYRAAGVIYKISETEMVGKNKDFPKRFILLEIPTLNRMDNQTTEILKFTVIGEQCGSLDWYESGEWVSILFKLTGRFWKPKDEPDKEVHFQNLEIIDIAREQNPFEMNQEPESSSAEEISPDLFEELEKRSEKLKEEMKGKSDNKDVDDLPF